MPNTVRLLPHPLGNTRFDDQPPQNNVGRIYNNEQDTDVDTHHNMPLDDEVWLTMARHFELWAILEEQYAHAITVHFTIIWRGPQGQVAYFCLFFCFLGVGPLPKLLRGPCKNDQHDNPTKTKRGGERRPPPPFAFLAYGILGVPA